MTARSGRLSPASVAALALAALALATSACATSPYQRAGNADDVATAVARAHPAVATARSLAFLVLGGAAGPRLAEYDLGASRLVWTQPTDVTTRVEVGATVIVHGDKGSTPNGEMVGRDLGRAPRSGGTPSPRRSTSTATPSRATHCSW